jgi:hypothetical protein
MMCWSQQQAAYASTAGLHMQRTSQHHNSCRVLWVKKSGLRCA